MNGSSELAQLAHLLRVGADALRQIAGLKDDDGRQVMKLAYETETIAAKLDVIAIANKRHQ